MNIKHLAEAVILQAIEDLWDQDDRAESIKFFAGEDFRTCASIAGIDIVEQIKILKMLDKHIKGTKKPVITGKTISCKHIFPQAEMREAART
jgi:hypothetical protein